MDEAVDLCDDLLAELDTLITLTAEGIEQGFDWSEIVTMR